METERSNEAETRSHHPFSPSQLSSLEYCPCYNSRASDNYKASRGTLQHEVVETGEDNPELFDDEAEAAAECLELVKHHKAEMEEDRKAAELSFKEPLPEVLELKEIYLPVDDTLWRVEDAKGSVRCFPSTTGGYVDRVLISHTRKEARMFDWKFGMWKVDEAAYNLQGIAYALGLWRKYPSIDKITFFFKQPHLAVMSHYTWHREKDFNNLYTRVAAVVTRAVEARARGDFSLANPGHPICIFCANLAVCPKVIKYAAVTATKFHPLEFPKEITPTFVLDPKNSALGLRLAQVIAAWAEAFRRQVTDRVIRRDAPPPDGYRLESRSERNLVDKALLKKIALNFLTPDEYETCVEPSFTAIEKAVSFKAPRGSKEKTVKSLGQQWETAGAVKRGTPYTFLRAVSSDSEEQTK